MAERDSRRRQRRARAIEWLEDRRVMAADSSTELLGAPVSQHVLPQQSIVQHGSPVDAPGGPALDHHARPDADFWLDPTAERDLGAVLGDIEQMLSSAHGQSGLTQVRNNYGFIGAGQTVAIIDSGIAYDHNALGSGWGPNFRVVGGWDFTENDANFYDDGPEGSHGTHVAGIVGADRSGTNDDGVAPGVDLVGLRVFNDAGEGWFGWVESALQWVHANRNAFENPITAVNLSLGSDWNSNSVPNWSTIEDEFAQLKADGIFISVSAGNDFELYNTPGLSYPAASPNVVPVMSVDDNGTMSYFSQRHTRAIAAPGRFITSTVPDYAGNHNGVTDDFASFSGTSMAAPYIAGASVLLREAMQFVGYTGITQDTIYNHMMATADTFFDSATGQNYKRLDLQSAFSALMPADEYGSTAGAAHNLGTLSGSSQVDGLIGTLSDDDYFRFTAASTGTVTFTATTMTHGLDPVWTGPGTVSGANGQTFTVDVVAGQTYTVGLSTSAGIGWYVLDVVAESSFTYVDWGTITQTQINNISSNGETWYRIQASRAGYFTTEALFNTANGNVDISLYNSNLQWIANGTVSGGGEWINVTAAANGEYYLRVVGTNADVDFRLTNLVSLSGNAVNVAGTTVDDVFSVAMSGSQHSLSVNGVTYNFDKSAVTTINFTGEAGSDTMTMTGSSGADTGTFRLGEATLTGSGFTYTALGVESVTMNTGGGSDTANFYDTAGDDRLVAKPNFTYLSGNNFYHRATGFANVYGYATAGGNDISELYDTAGSDQFKGKPTFSTFTGANMYRYVQGFDYVYAYSFAGGNDVAELYDSPNDDIYTAYWDYCALRTGMSFNLVRNFEYVYAYASVGGYDTANMYDSPGDDQFIGRPDNSLYRGTGFQNTVKYFDKVKAFSLYGGTDTATLFGTSGNDTLTSYQNESWFYGSGYQLSAHNFSNTKIRGMGGNDTAQLAGVATGDTLYGRSDFLYWYQATGRVQVEEFDHIAATLAAGALANIDVQSVDYVFEVL
jgi:subtilisin family serine protease